jgi:ArsR family transcriptional regulator
MDDLVAIYSCLCDRTRLRILNLLRRSPLCVCHVQSILGEPQVKVSKHLGYLKTHGIVDVSREGKWRIYRLTERRSKAVESNLACLQDCTAEDPVFRRDSRALETLLRRADRQEAAGCAPVCLERNKNS